MSYNFTRNSYRQAQTHYPKKLSFIFPSSCCCQQLSTRPDPPIQGKQGNTSSCLSHRFFCSNNMAAKNSLSSSLGQPLIALTYMQGTLYSSKNSNDYPNAKIQYSHGDHNNSKKFPKTSSEFNSEYPMEQREPSWFHFSLQVLLLGSFPHLFHSGQAYHTARTVLSVHRLFFFPFFFFFPLCPVAGR